MSENAIKRIIDKVINDEFPDITLTAEQKELIETFIGNLREAIKKLAEYITNNLVPAIEDAVKFVADLVNKQSNDYSRQIINSKMLIKQEIRPLYLDKRRNIHICSRSNC